MTAPGMSSKWGSFFQQAVAGVEARLDNMLSEGDYAPDAVKEATSTAADDDPRPVAGHTAQPVQPPTSRPNSRLQERLAKVVTSKSVSCATGEGGGSPTRQVEGAATAEESSENGQAHSGPPTSPVEGEVQNDIGIVQTATESRSPAPDEATSMIPHDKHAGLSLPSGAATQGGPTRTREPVHDNADKDCPTCGLGRNRIQTLEAKLTEVESLSREERHTHVERADALESKLKFLTREMAESGQKLAASSTAGGLEKRLAEKDEKIALLVNEGQTLAATEHKHRSVIKKLRSSASERDTTLTRLKGENEKLTAQLKSLQASAAAADSLRSEMEALRTKHNSLQAESSRLTLECNAKDGTIKTLELELAKIDRAPNSEGPDAKSDTEEEKRRVVELEELATLLRAEKDMAVEKAQLQIDELQKKADAATEQSCQMKNELQTLEGKLEAMRVIAEEASSNAAGDAQAKLLRQIETLQSQYATACENWQGIEATLTSRITVLEKERDEMSEKESSTRKKARDLTSQNRQQAEDLGQLRAQIHDYQQEGEASQRDLTQLRKRVEIAEASLTEASEQRRPSKESDDKARRVMSDATPPHTEHSPRVPGRPLSPLHSPLRTWSSELLVPHSTSKLSHPGSVIGSPFDGFKGPSSPRYLGEQTEARTPDLPDPASPPVSGKSYPIYDASADPATERLSSQGQVRDDVSEENADTLSTIHLAIPDIASVSTTAAGPSIQLVERMSAGIRRLEAEKVAGKEELLRISNQRDEARAEMVTLMKETESGRQARDRVTALEKEVAEINERYQTTLELLGEKSELVEELRADVQDVKAMYRELVERTIR